MKIDDPALHDPAAWRSLLGTRVTVRYRTGDPDHPHGSSAGLLQSVTPEGALTLLTRRGDERMVPIEDIEVAKRI